MILSNARLTTITGPGVPDRSGRRTGEGETLWSGNLEVYLRRASKMETVGGNMTRREFDQLIFQGAIPAGIDIGSQLRGSVLTIEDRRTTTAEARKFRAVGIETIAAQLSVDSVRVELAEERE